MTPLGLDPVSLRREIRQYRLRIRALIGSLDAAGRGTPMETGVDALVDELIAAVEVDVLSRGGAAGRERMSRLESHALLPMLEVLRRGLRELATTPRPRDLLARLQALDDHVGAVEATLYATPDHSTGCAPPAGGSPAGR